MALCLIVFAGRDGQNVLTLPAERFPRRASDGCASIGQYRGPMERDEEASTSASSATQIKAIQQEHQALQVSFSLSNAILITCLNII